MSEKTKIRNLNEDPRLTGPRRELVDAQLRHRKAQMVYEDLCRTPGKAYVSNVEAKARAMNPELFGDPEEGDFATPEDLKAAKEDLHASAMVVGRLKKKVEAELEAVASEIREEIRPEIKAVDHQVAKAAAALSEAVTERLRHQDELDNAGIPWTGHFPVLSVAWADARQRDSRLNLLVDELENGWGFSVQRKTLQESVKRQHETHMEAEREKAEQKAREAKRLEEAHKSARKAHQRFLEKLSGFRPAPEG